MTPSTMSAARHEPRQRQRRRNTPTIAAAPRREKPGVRLLLGAELAVLFDPVLPTFGAESLLDRANGRANVCDHVPEAPPLHVARDDDPPGNVLVVQRVRPGGVEDVRHLRSGETFRPDGVSRIVCPMTEGSDRDAGSYQTTSENDFSPSKTVDTARPL